jgi:hypothetical protein
MSRLSWSSLHIALLSVALLATGIASAEAIIGGQPLKEPYETVVQPDDIIMACQGPRLPMTYNYDCHYYSSEITDSEVVSLPAVQVTDKVAGCEPGTQPSMAKTLTYATTATFSFGVAAKLDLKVLSGYKGLLANLKEYGPGLQAGFGYATSTTFGETQTYTIPADYGKVSWGVFSQEAVKATVNETVEITSTSIQGPPTIYCTAYGLTTLTPIAHDTTKFPQGTLGKSGRSFASVEEFNDLCPGGVLPDYLGGPGTTYW